MVAYRVHNEAKYRTLILCKPLILLGLIAIKPMAGSTIFMRGCWKDFNLFASLTNGVKKFSSYFLNFDAGARLEIMQMSSVPESAGNPYKQFAGIIHIAISVGSAEKVDTLTSDLSRDGYQVLDGPRKTGDGYYESVVLDPENNRVEITV